MPIKKENKLKTAKTERKKTAGKKKVVEDDLLPESRAFLKERRSRVAEADVLSAKARPAQKDSRKSELDQAYLDRMESEIREDQSKRLVIWTGVSFFMMLILIVWAYNMKNVFVQTAADLSDKNEQVNLDKITDDFKKSFGEVKNNMAGLKNLKDELMKKETASTSLEVRSENIEMLKEKLEGLSGAATMTAANQIVGKLPASD